MSDSKQQEIYVMGASLGTGNRGVAALGASLAKLIWENKPDARVSMLIGSRTNASHRVKFERTSREVYVLNYRRSFKAPLQQQLFIWVFLAVLYRFLPPFRSWICKRNSLVAKIAEAEFVGDIRGGDSFSDIYGITNFIWACLPVIAVLLVRRNLVLLPQTYGPFKSSIAKVFARWILRRAKLILCRDQESVRLVHELIGPDCPTQFCPDVAFCLEPAPPENPAIEPPLSSSIGSTLVGLNVNGLVYNGGYTRSNMFGLKLDYPAYVAEVAKALLTQSDTRLLLVPHTFAPDHDVESDPSACRKLKASLPEALQARVHIVAREYDQHEIKGIIGSCDFFIGSRMHACIAALSQGIPTVGVAYSKKFKGVFSTLGVEYCVIDGRQCDVSEAVERTVNMFLNREANRADLKPRVAQVQRTVRHAFADMLASNRNSNSTLVPA